MAVSEWARAHGFAPSVVFALLEGRAKGRRSEAHRAAIALGLKPAVKDGEQAPLLGTRDTNAKIKLSGAINKPKGKAM